MKRRAIGICALLLALCMLTAHALTGKSKSYIPCDCGRDPCACFIQLGDEGGFVRAIGERLCDLEYVDETTPTGIFSEEIEQAVIRFQYDNGLPHTGTMDDDTLTLLLWGMSPEELDVRMPIRRTDPSTYPDPVFIPTDGGEKRHSKPTCSGMLDSRKVSIRNAALAGFDACGKRGCERSRENTALRWGR